MKNAWTTIGLAVTCVLFIGSDEASAKDWPQWRGPERDGRASGFVAPATWPKALTKKWSVTVGSGVATPALVGDKLFVYTREGGEDVIRCLNAETGKQLWMDKNPAAAASTPGGKNYEGPRSSPAVADGKVVTFGAHGTLSCYDVAGKQLWRKDDIKGYWPQFFAASSPLIVDGLCVAQIGGKEGGRGKTDGAIVAYDLTSGAEKWKWLGSSPGYGSPMLMNVGGDKLIIAETDSEVVALNAKTGKDVWETPCKTRYNASTPVVHGQTIVFEGGNRGEKAVKLVKKGDGFAAENLWTNADAAVIYNSPVAVGNQLFGVTQSNHFFCVNLDTGKTAWSVADPSGPATGGGGAGKGGGGAGKGGGGAGKGGGRGGRMMGGGGGYGSVVDLGSVLVGLTPRGRLTFFEPSDKAFKEVAGYKVAEGQTYAYPVVSGNRIYIKDGDSVTMWTVE